MIINGFLVVRAPEENEVVHVPPVRLVPSLNGIFYAGIDRCEWFDLYDEDYYSGAAPRRIASIAKAMEKECVDFSGIELTRDFNIARELLAYSNRSIARNEIVAIRSSQLDEVKGTLDTDVPIEWLGLDVFGEGEWSLISYGLFASPERFGKWTGRVNASGLFDTPQDASEYERAYQTAVTLGQVEALAPPSDGFRVLQVRVGRVAT
jgi:hypothetical protein